MSAAVVREEEAADSRAEELVETLRDALGTLPVTPFDTQHAPAGSMAAASGSPAIHLA